jgi:hypothetical protein
MDIIYYKQLFRHRYTMAHAEPKKRREAGCYVPLYTSNSAMRAQRAVGWEVSPPFPGLACVVDTHSTLRWGVRKWHSMIRLRRGSSFLLPLLRPFILGCEDQGTFVDRYYHVFTSLIPVGKKILRTSCKFMHLDLCTEFPNAISTR